MKSLNFFDRIFYESKSIEEKYFPMIEEENFTYMNTVAARDNGSVVCFSYYRYCDNNPYIDIYIWDVMLPGGYKRFVLSEGYALNETDEHIFLRYLSGQIKFEEVLLQQLIIKVNREIPQIHLIPYADRRHIVLHIYYTLHRSGVYEILYKANLDYLADGLDQIDCYNMIGTSPQQIFDVQLGLLHSLNSPEGVNFLLTPEDRKTASNIYAKYHNLIYGVRLNKYQWKYLCELIYKDEMPDKRMCDMLGRIKSDTQYYTYLRYLEYREIIAEYYTLLPKYPMADEIAEKAEICCTIEWCIEHEKILNSRLRDRAVLYRQRYCYETDEYFIVIPASVKAFLEESVQQHNCLYRYVIEMACNDTIILFVREKNNPCKSLVTLEVSDGSIWQAWQAFNNRLSEKQKEFLEKFAEARDLYICADDFYDEDFYNEDVI